MRRLVRSFRTGESGQGLVEYAFLIGLVALVLIGVLQAFRRSVHEVTERAAVTVSSQAGGYGGLPHPRPGPVVGGTPSTSVGSEEEEEEPDSSPPDSAEAPVLVHARPISR